MKRALIFGVTGQDGSYLSELLLSKGYEVHGVKRRGSSLNTQRVDHLFDRSDFTLHYGDVTDSESTLSIIQRVDPDEIYNLAAQSHVQVSFETPLYTAEADALGALRILEAMRILASKAKFYQASSSEMFGGGTRLSETSPFRPKSPYACAKLYAHWTTINYREAYGLDARAGILFNHEGPRRGETFVTRKISMAVAEIFCGKRDKLYVGNLDASRDWGYARDYIKGMWLMMQAPPKEYVLATGETHTVREFIERAFFEIYKEVYWEGCAEKEVGKIDGKIVVEVDKRYYRPNEVWILHGDASLAERDLNWKRTLNFNELVRVMVQSDIRGKHGEA